MNVTIDAPKTTTYALGAPKLKLAYSGTAADPDVRVYAQIVDEVSGKVLGNLVTPLPLTLDGQELGHLDAGDAVTCTGGPRPARLVSFGPRDFHQILTVKFGLADR